MRIHFFNQFLNEKNNQKLLQSFSFQYEVEFRLLQKSFLKAGNNTNTQFLHKKGTAGSTFEAQCIQCNIIQFNTRQTNRNPVHSLGNIFFLKETILQMF